ncbi:MAG: type II toxin-antitoxin system Phd/YefM family antitoxin [Halarsenatibacteraceae bacterium]
MTEIRPLDDLKNTEKISELCHQSDEPIYITKDGYGDLVVMSKKSYDKKLARLELYEKIAKGEKDIETGNLIDIDGAFEGLV